MGMKVHLWEGSFHFDQPRFSGSSKGSMCAGSTRPKWTGTSVSTRDGSRCKRHTQRPKGLECGGAMFGRDTLLLADAIAKDTESGLLLE